MLTELRMVLRGLLRTPGFVFVVVLSLGIGIGSTTTAMAWIDSFLIHPLAGVPASDRILSVYTRGPEGAQWSVSYPRFTRWRDALGPAVKGFASFSGRQFSFKSDGYGPERVWSAVVSGDFFDVLGVRPAHGRLLTRLDETGATPVAVITDRFWERAFKRDPRAIGTAILVNGQGFTVVGIAPPGFHGPMVGLSLDLYVPITTLPAVDPGNTSLTADGWQYLDTVARLADGATVAQAAAAFDLVSRQVAQSLGDRVPTVAGVRLLSETGATIFIKPLFYTLFGLAGVILLIASANVANLLLVRATRRGKELGIRLALGAGRGRLVRHLLTESLLLGLGGGALGVLLAFWGRGALAAVVPALPLPIDLSATISLPVLAAATLVTVGTALLVGLVPAVRATRPSLVGALKDELLPGSPRSWLRSGLVVSQVALSLIALVSAGLFLRSLRAAQAIDPGFRAPGSVLVGTTGLHMAGYPDSVGRGKMVQLLQRIRAIPGVTAAGTVDDLPMTLGNNSSRSVQPEGYEFGPAENTSIACASASDGYFEALGITVLQGRSFQAEDRRGAMPVVVVSQSFAKKYFRNRPAVGSLIIDGSVKWTVVGVVNDVVNERIGEVTPPFIYYPNDQFFNDEAFVVVRASVNPRSLIEPVRKAFQSIDPNLPFLEPRTMTESMAAGTFVQSMGVRLLGFMGVLALLLAAVGLYGVLSFAVTLRTREIGVRIALGAPERLVVGGVVGQSTRLVALGVVIGIGLAIGAATALRSQLFGVQPADPLTLAAVTVILLVVALAAAVLPARRAARVNPVITLRSE